MTDTPHKSEAAYLINQDTLLHLKETEQGIFYEAFHSAGGAAIATGTVPTSEISGGTLVDARAFCLEQSGIKADSIAAVGLTMMRDCAGSDIRRRSILDPASLPQDDIRFIDSKYNELFRIPNGSNIEITQQDWHTTLPCEYMDEYHTRLGGEVFHICQFAERMERTGRNYQPEHESDALRGTWEVGISNRLEISAAENGWEYSLSNKFGESIDSGVITDTALGINQVRDSVLRANGLQNRSMKAIDHAQLQDHDAKASVLDQLHASGTQSKSTKSTSRREPER